MIYDTPVSGSRNRSRGIVDVTNQPWMGYEQKLGSEYIFKIRLCIYIEVANYPLIQIGVSKINLDPALWLSIAEMMRAIPATIALNEEFPKTDGSGSWFAPESMKFDRATSPSYVNPNDYTSLTVIPWTVPTFFESTVYFIPTASSYTPIPSSIPDMIKTPLSGDSAVFMPIKTAYTQTKRRVATNQLTFDYTVAYFDYAFVYDGCDLDPDHIWEIYDIVQPYVSRPYVQYNDIQGIISCNSTIGGYTIKYESGTGIYYCYIEPYGGSMEAEYYPPRNPKWAGGVIGAIFGSFLGLLSSGQFGLSAREETGIKL